MSFEAHQGKLTGFKAGADLSANAQFRWVKQGAAAGEAILCSAATDIPLGILQNNPKLGEGCEIVNSGISKCYAGAAVALGARVAPDATGRSATGGAGTGQGQALEAASAAGEVIAVLLPVRE